ncbi:MAG: hypothetical protein H0U98_08855 [Alphaproteobacteria bacterium]|nr:hypothetical protein [Alphaproteobacteria bacterium]
MKKKPRRKSNKSSIKQKLFRDRNISGLEAHHREGKTLRTPLNKLPGGVQNPHSWTDECIPNVLWACILASQLERSEYLALFRHVDINAKECLTRPDDNFITHNYLSLLDRESFKTIFAQVLTNERACKALSALRLLDCLPDKGHWAECIPAPSADEGWQTLAAAVSDTFDHQSEKSTDIRWLKLMYLLISGRVNVAEALMPRIEEFRLFPDKGDMRQVRPSIRAFEIAFRDFEFGDTKIDGISLPPNHGPEFWVEMKTKTQCIMVKEFEPPQRAPRELAQEVADVMRKLQDHFIETSVTTAPDPRHDGSFGLALYAISLLLNLSTGFHHGTVEGRIVLRSVVEALITLTYLAKKDEQGLWSQYRRYGSGQAKLAFLKNIREKETPAFVDLKLIERLANEDMWMEFQDIHVGNWANLTLRGMAQDGGVKDVYDKHYDWASGYAHGQWICVRDAVFVNCVNPLHRFHRIPGVPIATMPSVLPDACSLVNRILETLNKLYPSFKARIKWHNRTDVSHSAGVSSDSSPAEPNT